MINSYKDKHSQTLLIDRSVSLNGWVFAHKRSGYRFESRCNQLNFRYQSCFGQGFLWHLSYYRMWIHAETRMSRDKIIQSNAPERTVLTRQLNQLIGLAKWLNVRLQITWLWVRIPLQPPKCHMSPLFEGRILWHSGNHGVWINSKTHPWHDKIIHR